MKRCKLILEFDLGMGEGAPDPLVWIDYISKAVLPHFEYEPKVRIVSVKIEEREKDAA